MKKQVGATGILNTIYERRSVRRFLDKPVEKFLIDQVIDAGRMAPSAMNGQPWKFYVLSDREKIKSLSHQIARITLKDFFKTGYHQLSRQLSHLLHFPRGIAIARRPDPIFHGAPVVIFLTTPAGSEWAGLDAGMCAENMLLAAKALGLAACPVGLVRLLKKTRDYSSLGIPGDEILQLAIILGYGDEKPTPPPRKKGNVTYLGLKSVPAFRAGG